MNLLTVLRNEWYSRKFFYSMEAANLVVLFSIIAWYGVLNDSLLYVSFFGVLIRHALLIYLFYHVFRKTRVP